MTNVTRITLAPEETIVSMKIAGITATSIGSLTEGAIRWLGSLEMSRWLEGDREGRPETLPRATTWRVLREGLRLRGGLRHLNENALEELWPGSIVESCDNLALTWAMTVWRAYHDVRRVEDRVRCLSVSACNDEGAA